MNKIAAFILFFAGCLLSACAPRVHVDTQDWSLATREVVTEFSPYVHDHLGLAFAQRHVSFPPREIALVTFKKEGMMSLWARDHFHRHWVFIKHYPLQARSGRPGPKLHIDDDQIPEGIYHVLFLDPFSHYHLSMKLDYPNPYDLAKAALDKRTDLGGDIFIHGKNLSVGCLAIGDHAIDELFVLVSEVGVDNTKIIIAPNDLRIAPPVISAANQPAWVGELYDALAKELRSFPIDTETNALNYKHF